jgi:hypothetical protein
MLDWSSVAICQRSAKPVRTEPYKAGSTRMTTSASSLLSSADMTYADDRRPIRMSLTRLKPEAPR